MCSYGLYSSSPPSQTNIPRQVLAVHPLRADHPRPQPPLHLGHLQGGALGHPQQKAQHSSKVQGGFLKSLKS